MVSENTTNLSFKNMQYRLQDAGIENCFFMNETINKDLVDIDVYQTIDKYRNDPKKKAAFISRVQMECEKNIWYFFREVVRIPDEYHIIAKDSTGLSRYPLTDDMCKLIYMYDHGLSPVSICCKDLKTISYLTMVCLAIREEFFLTHEIDYTSSFVSFTDHSDKEEIFKETMQELLWGMNDVIGSMDGLTPKHNGSMPWNFKVFDHRQKINTYNENRNAYICPYIANDVDIKEFLDQSQKRMYRYCVGRVVGDNISSLQIYQAYILDNSFALKKDYTLFDTNLDEIDTFKQFKVL